MNSTQLLDRTYETLARSRIPTRATLRMRGIATAVLRKRPAPNFVALAPATYARFAGAVESIW